jgi:hypothetical protein
MVNISVTLDNTFYCYLSNDFTLLLNTFSFAICSMLIVNPNLVVYILKFTLYLEEGNCFKVVKKKGYMPKSSFSYLHYHVSQCMLL